MAYQITDVCHRPGRLNPVADGLSHKFMNLSVEDGNRHEWTVSEDWEERTRLTGDILIISENNLVLEATMIHAAMLERFLEEKVFKEIIGSLLELDHLCDRKRAQHKAKGYMVEDGKLWKVGDQNSVRLRPQVECVTQKEVAALAWALHHDKGHFHQDNIKTELIDKILSPKLERSITMAIMDCGHCKNFRPSHIHSLLEPITQ